MLDIMPWQLRKSELIPYRDTLPIPLNEMALPSDYSEAEMHRVSTLNRRNETQPPSVKHFPIGSWMSLIDGTLYHLRRLPLRQLHRSEETKPLMTVRKYADWYCAGHRWPALHGVENIAGKIILTDGHHRLDAAALLGLPTVDVWVNYIYWRPFFDGTGRYHSDWTHVKAIQLARRLGISIAPNILADYPEL
jgi:hypothetical protein